MGGAAKPQAPNPGKDLKESTKVYLKYLPQLLQAEQSARTQYDPQRIQEQQGLQAQYGQTQYQQQLDALHQLDPQSNAIRGQLAKQTYDNLMSGYTLPSGLQQEVTSQIRGAESARGNVLGNAPISAEALYAGNAAQQLYQQHITNAMGFLAGPTPEQQLLSVQPVSADRASAYVNPGAPAQAAQNSYQNYLAQYQASGGGQPSPWLQAAQGIGQAAATYYGGPVAGAAAGAASNYTNQYFSDHRLKHHIVYIGRSASGLPIHEFTYNDGGRYRGVIAQEILSIRPDAVSKGKDGYYRVDYSKLDVPFEPIPDLAEVT